MNDEPIVTLHGERELIDRAGHLFAGARHEFLVAAADPGTWSAGVNTAFRAGLRPGRAPDGPVLHKLYTPQALPDAHAERRLARMAATGADIRICAAPLAQETIILDRRTAILAGTPAVGTRTYTVIRSPDVVAGLRSLVRAAWATSPDLDEHLRRRPAELGEEARRILRMLGAGHTDESAARLLGMSLRTYRRRVADLMDALGATSRFQAGARARELEGGVGGGPLPARTPL
ncbi:DNA-binding response regulator [Streptomyces sp. NBC_00083]|uniref:helix-turn-helix transcriptional regulator n=1 Tax=Streptomyces sp. NBC_00083 TaxID=2975647 RepID=UPI002254AF2C|nr:DNA-binding response regulator [Streptomyces sp. NBC_00083]MCX5388055.1 DNA-binding response regulator [Streptomyces sp. NBC_00083]